MRKPLMIAAGVASTAVLMLSTGCGSTYDQQHNHNTSVGPYSEPKNVVIEFP
jgi:hypothetical protein